MVVNRPASSARTEAVRASDSRTAGLNRLSRYGISSWRTRLREERGVRVGRILAPGQATRGQVVEARRCRETRSSGRKQVARAGAHGGEPVAARAAQETQEDGLGLVVAGVGERR